MPHSPVFLGNFSIQENLDISQPSLPFPCCRPRLSLVAPRTQRPALAACPQLLPASRQQGREKDKQGTHVHGSPTCRISQRIRVSWMLLRAKGHSCLSSRLLFSRTNWRRGSLPCITRSRNSEGKLSPPSPSRTILTEVIYCPQNPAPASSFPCHSAGPDRRHSGSECG